MVSIRSSKCFRIETVLLFWCSDWRFNKHHIRPDIHLRTWIRRQRRSHCPCYFAVSFYYFPHFNSFYCLVSILQLWLFYRFLITLILLWRLMKQVDLLPPSVKDLQFGRFLKNGKPWIYISVYKQALGLGKIYTWKVVHISHRTNDNL